jgi:hypothetical protein
MIASAMGSRSAAIITLFCWACSPVDDLTFSELPENVAFVGILDVDSSSEASGTLYRLDAHGFARSSLRGRAGLIVAYGDLPAALSLEAERAQDESSIASAKNCEPRLPSPLWARRVVEGEAREVGSELLPELTVAWARDACEVSPSGWKATLSEECGIGCEPSLLPSDTRCGFRVTGCVFPAVEGALRADGHACLRSVDSSAACTERSASTSARGELECAQPAPIERCRMAVFPDTPPDWKIESIDALDMTLPPKPAGTYQFLSSVAGYLADALLQGAEIVVSDFGGENRLKCLDANSRFHRFDRQSLAGAGTVSSTITCVQTMAVDPLAPDGGLVVAHKTETQIWISRLDAAGRVLVSAPVAARGRPVFQVYAPDLLWSERFSRLVLLTTSSGHREEKFVGIEMRDPETLALTAELEVRDRFISGAIFARPDELVLTDQEREALMYVGLAADELTLEREVELNELYLGSPLDTVLLPGGGSVSLLEGQVPTIQVADPDGTVSRGGFPAGFQPAKSALWKDGPLVLLTLVAEEDWDTALALLDPAGPYVLPTSLTTGVGFGPSRRALRGEVGTIWLMLPHSAQLLRVRP